MTDIKVGQVWGFGEKDRLVITNIFYEDIYVLWNDGSTDSDDNINWLLEGGNLLTIYPTWQDAVSSPEFNTKA